MKIPEYHWLRIKPIVHRGIYDNKTIFENTIESCMLAVKQNLPFEIDIRITKDDTIILFHDKSLKRLLGIDKYYYDLTKEDIKTLKYKNNNSKINTLKELLSVVNGKVPILIELKYDKKICSIKRFITKLYEVLNDYKGEYAIQSFCPKINYYKKLSPLTYTGIIISKIFKKEFLNNLYLLLLLILHNYDFISFNIDYMPNKVIENTKLPIIFWLIDNIHKKELAKKHNGNYIYTQKL